MAADESDLIGEACDGSKQAQAELFRRYWRDAWRTAKAVCGDNHAAEDIAQEAFLRAFRQLHTYNARGPFGDGCDGSW